jgi:hypothetical protein
MVLMATVLVAAATVLLEARAAVAAIQVPRAVMITVAMTAARKRLQQLLLLLLVIKLRLLLPLPWFTLSPLPPLLSAFTRPPKRRRNFGTLFRP